MKKQDVRDLVLSALLIALVTVSTMMIQVPVPMTNGYIHLGDSMIFLVGIFFGRKKGMLAGGIGSMFADIFSGYAHWALFTLIIKGCMGFVVGSIGFKKKNKAFFSMPMFLSLLVGSLVMVTGYFIGGSILKSSMLVALQSVPENMIQAGLGAVIFLVVGKAFDKISLQEYFEKKA